ncbi:MAG: bifunctional ornithine acetyltransferase/N-acetylglutamate synthase, partial [Bacillati bacterium ANGP1]
GEHLAGESVQVTVDLGLGRGEAVVWTCDLSEEYVKENAGELS